MLFPILRIFLFSIICLGQAYSQGREPQPRSYSTRGVSWMGVFVDQRLSDKLNLEVDLQYRTQNYRKRNLNIFSDYWYQGYRVFLNYKFTENFSFAISPFMYTHEVPINPEDDIYNEVTHELRWSARARLENTYKFFEIRHEYRQEYRRRTDFETDGFWPEWRLRYMFRVKVPVKRFCDNIIFNNEVFINFGKYIRDDIFDQNRTQLVLEKEIGDKFTLTFGYMNILEQRGGGDAFNILHALVLNFEFHDLYKTKK